ncbi:MAG: pyridoxal 5'-phosphate synthase glutaminase subunit PdxT [Clostridiales bacterium]|nr:pyridoxal 5'-phosphate synthase glutaminase subunit PdxT [Clostridiales bacterium]
MTIGVLSYQGSVIEHMKALERLDGVRAVEVNKPNMLSEIDGLILPGGESTTISKLMNIFGMTEPIKKRIQDGMPVWGTCAGLILLAKSILGEAPHLGVMDITVKRNAYGAQIDSFKTTAVIPEVSSKAVELVFIRAPRIEAVENDASVLCTVDNHIVAARQNNMLATSFHPELTEDSSFHNYFANMVRNAK